MTVVDPAVGDDTRRHLTHVARGGALNLLGAGISAVAGFAVVLVVTNRYPTDAAGLFFTVTSAFMLLAAIATLGTETGLGRFLLRYEAQGRHGDIPPTLRAAFRPTILYSLLIAAGVLAFAEPLGELIGLDGDAGTASVRVLALALPLATFQALALSGTRAFGRMRTTVLVEKISRPLGQLALVLGVSYAAAGLLGLTVAWALPYLFAAVAASVVFRRFLRRRGTLDHTEPTRTYRELRREFWVFTWPRSITRISQMAIQRMDIILVAALRSPTEAAIYTAATRFVALGQFGTQAIQQVVQPKFTALLASEDKSLPGVYQISAAWSMTVTWPMYVGVAAAPLVYLGLFGEQYAAAGVPVVVLMALAMLFAVATGPCDTLLLMSGRSGLSLFNSLAALVVDLVLLVVLIPRMGITGAALAWAVAVTLRSGLALVQVRWTMKIISLSTAAGVAALANLVCFGLPLLVVGRFVELDLTTLALVLLFCFPAYALALWWGRRVLMLDVLRGLFRRSSTPRGRHRADDGDGDGDGDGDSAADVDGRADA